MTKKQLVHVKYKAKFQYDPSDWIEAKEYFDNRCAYCNSRFQISKEHIIPKSQSGGYVRENIIPACIKCNNSKSNSELCTWYRKQQFYSIIREIKIKNYVILKSVLTKY